jgi:hypothetical protein
LLLNVSVSVRRGATTATGNSSWCCTGESLLTS